jgi:hypothetical protein
MTPRRSSARPWTPTDDDRLRALATAGANPKAIGMELNRTQIGITPLFRTAALAAHPR